MTPFATRAIVKGYVARLDDMRDTATLGAYQGEYLARTKYMPPIDDLLSSKRRAPPEHQTPKEIVANVRLWLRRNRKARDGQVKQRTPPSQESVDVG